MKPIALKLTNFGPYISETIDFENFFQTSLFLITGKTGSGKTTIFDGLSYALYGETTGGIREGKEMRSNFANEEEPTRVTLRFSHKELFYVVEREPEQVLKKKVGEGTTTRPAKVTLTVFDEAGKELKQLIKARDVQNYIEELLHLNAHQFTQIVLLPQGDFRKFLNANSNEKEVVLRRLFGTEIYRALSENIKNKKKEYSNKLEKDENEIQAYLNQLIWQEDKQLVRESLTAIDDVLSLLEEQQHIFSQEEKEKVHLLEKEREEKRLFEKELNRKQVLLDDFKQLEKLEEKKLVLAQEEVKMQEQENSLIRLNWVSRQEFLIKRYQESEASVSNLQEKLGSNSASIHAIQEALAEKKSSYQEILGQKDEIEKMREKIGLFGRILPLLKEKEEVEKEVAEQVKQEKSRTSTLEISAKKLKEIQLDLAKYQEEIATQEECLTEKNKLTIQANDFERILEQLSQRIQVQQELILLEERQQRNLESIEKSSSAVEEADKIYRKEKSHLAKLQIARLSMDLVEGEPCPVCGSKEHPAQHMTVEWDREKILESEFLVEKLEKEWNLEQQKRAKQEQEKDFLIQERMTVIAKKEEIDKEIVKRSQALSLEAIAIKRMEAEEVELLQKEVKGAEKTVQEQLTSLDNQLSHIQKAKLESEKLTEKSQIIQSEYQQHQIEVEKNQKIKMEKELNLAMIIREIPTEWESYNQVEKEKAQEEKRVSTWESRLKSLEEEVSQRESEFLVANNNQQHFEAQLTEEKIKQEKTESDLKEKIQESNYDYTIELLMAELPKIAHLSDLEQSVQQYKEAKKEWQVAFDQVNKKIQGQNRPDISKDVEKIAEKEQGIIVMEKELGSLQQNQEHNQKIQTQVLAKQKKLAKEWNELAELNQLSEVMNGDGPYNKMSLERFVLQAYFEEILRVGNERLLQLTGSRYSFELKKESGSYKSQTGLELNIYDDNVGAVRSVNTLSGGESFIAALSLSLSLAEVVQSQAGGVQIEAMFIDEGFGSLDEEALEMAMDALETIEGKGRMIGIISHVNELKQRIPQQLQVVSNGTGQSSIHYQTELE